MTTPPDERPADFRGECDRCHAEPVPVWELLDEPGGWAYCEGCWRAEDAEPDCEECGIGLGGREPARVGPRSGRWVCGRCAADERA